MYLGTCNKKGLKTGGTSTRAAAGRRANEKCNTTTHRTAPHRTRQRYRIPREATLTEATPPPSLPSEFQRAVGRPCSFGNLGAVSSWYPDNRAQIAFIQHISPFLFFGQRTQRRFFAQGTRRLSGAVPVAVFRRIGRAEERRSSKLAPKGGSSVHCAVSIAIEHFHNISYTAKK